MKHFETLCDEWLERRYKRVKRSTYSNYAYHVGKHIVPGLGNCALSAMERKDVEGFINEMKGKKLADSTIRVILMTFKSIVRYGVKQGLVREELLAGCRVVCRRRESRVLLNQDSLHMKEYLLEQPTAFSLGILICRGTGIRIGELCGLKWEDIDFAAGTFQVRRTVSRIVNPDISEGQPKTILYIRSPKSYTSVREIPIPPYLISALQTIRKDGDCYLLTGCKSCTEPRNVQKKFKTILRHCKMQDCNFHALRHGFATSCLENGVDCKTVSSILGHASTRTTLDIYGHTSLRQKQNCINGLA